MATLSEIVEEELGASLRSKLSRTSETSLASVASLSMPLVSHLLFQHFCLRMIQLCGFFSRFGLCYQIQEIVLSADIRCSDCQEKVADIMSRMIGEKTVYLLPRWGDTFCSSSHACFLCSFGPETYSILVSVLEKKVTLTCTYSGDRRISKSYGEALLCKISTIKRLICPSRKQQLKIAWFFAFYYHFSLQ